MGVITVEKCVFYIENVDAKTTLRGPEDRPHRYGRGIHTVPGFRTEAKVKIARIPYMGGIEKTVGYIHTNHIEGTATEFDRGSIKNVGSNLSDIRDFMLGRGKWTHPNLIIADVPDPKYLMSSRDMAAYYVHLAQQSTRIPRTVKPKLPGVRPFELWLPWDPTQRGRIPAKLSTTQRYVSQVLPVPVTNNLDFGRTREVQDDDLGFDAKGKALIIGTGFRLRFYNVPPPDVHWVPEIQSRVLDHLRKSGVKNADEWYAIGKFDPAWDYPDLVDRFRGRAFQTYTNHSGVKPVSQSSLIVRRIFKVNAKNPDDAKHKIRARLQQMAQDPKTRKIAVERALAWSRTGEQVVSRPAWDVMVKRKARLDEELYCPNSPGGVY